MDKSKNEAVNIEYWGLWDSQSTMDSIIGDYKKTKPNVNISYKKKSIQQYRESLSSQIDSGKGPDMFVFHNTWTPMLKDQLSPVPSSVVSASEIKNNFYPAVSQDLIANGKLVGLPTEVDGLELYYNEDVFKAAGIIKPPTTWSEFAQDAVKLTVRDSQGGIRTAGAAIGTISNVDHFSDLLGLMIMQNGGDLKSPTDKQSAEALQYYLSFAQGNNKVWDELQPPSTVAFSGGNVAMYFGPSFRAIEIKNANPQLKFKVAPVPQLEGNKIAWASYWANGVSAKSTNKQEAWEFAKYLEKEDVLIKRFSENAKSPSRFFGEPYPLVSMASKLASDPVLGAFVTDAPYARSFPLTSRTFDSGINDQIIKAYEDAVNSVIKGAQPKTALETTAKNVSQILTRFGAK
ncbi:hypothetical protein A2870_04210 [Candidatus Curtissbacteria bacterium RIFCSPHIGHO2_01_FULL_41_11]|uniref:ABC transporter substrate-binding protein n=1 Tax=Candidatus Curtissbacteria bacterium RIFCSPHIGHO2_01_FULL_41_11 TaxID=1797711 RepID=A0A1F5G6T6_9BACT|nr:MAG: hypothetical protein A2870_04210 [Candidatus Curtissbacteria bacterium RIFCSPHIGHO2_01_FULL_41_11]